MPLALAACSMVSPSSTANFLPFIVMFVIAFTYLLSQCRQRIASAIALSLW